MTLISKIFPIAAAGVLALTALSGCFTGIEKTPAIKDTSSSGTRSRLTPEQELLKNIAPQALQDWAVGKPFIVTDGRLNYAYTPASEAEKLSAGDTLRYSSVRQTVRLSGDTITEIHLTSPRGGELTTVVESPLTTIGNGYVQLPFTVDAELVDDVRRLLRGRTVWTLRTDRSGKRYQKTEIKDILPGQADFPFIVVLPGDSLRMVLNSRSSSARTFNNLFTLSDPRKQYPQISNHNWELICSGKVAQDMTREECRLAIGAPDDIDRNATYSGMIERWTYKDGKFLVFTDGLLTRFRI